MRREEREALVNLLDAYHSATVAQIAEVMVSMSGDRQTQNRIHEEVERRIAEIEIAAHGFIDSIGV